MDLGRARGRAAGRGSRDTLDVGLFPPRPPSVPPTDPAAQRGRGGLFRNADNINTIPPGVKQTTGDNKGDIKIITNYFRLIVPKECMVYSYRVDFDPQVESVKVRRGLIYENRQVFDRAYVYDGGSEIKALVRLAQDVVVAGTRRDGSSVDIKIKFTSTVPWGHPEMMRLYNTQMRRNFEYLGFKQVGRDFYNPAVKKSMEQYKLEIWPGFATAVAEHDGGILMVADNINKIIRHETAYNVLDQVFKNERENRQDKARKELIGCVVMTEYNNKTYRIDEIAFDKNPTDFTFERREGTISLTEYYRNAYKIEIRDGKQPLLLVQPTEKAIRGGDNKEIFLVPELCTMTGLSKSLIDNFTFKKALGDLTRMDPLKRAQELTGFIKRLNANDQVREEMRAWGLTFSESLVDLNARMLPAERIIIHNDAVGYNQKTGSFEREMRSKRMIKPVRLEQWAVLLLKRDKPLVDDFIASLNRICAPMGIEVGGAKLMPVEGDRPGDWLRACEAVPKGAKMVVAVVPNTNAERYATIKQHFCLRVPCPSQVITTRVLSNKKNLMSVATKVLIQMSTKMGAEPWGIAIPPKGCMIVGYDTYHDSLKKGKSVGGFVCTTNSAATSWFSRTSYHTNRDELCGNFAHNFRIGLRNWYERNNSWPERIVIYRDGVSEGQIPHVFDVELRQMESVMKEKEGLDKANFVFTIVTKRVNARFFSRVGDKQLENPPPGTTIDSVVTRKNRYDFYLISQSVRQGTVNPTMYNIIADNTNWRPQHHQQLAYKLCHVYYNWAGTITVPAPCQYAHKLAYLTGTALHQEHSHELSHTLFFL